MNTKCTHPPTHTVIRTGEKCPAQQIHLQQLWLYSHGSKQIPVLLHDSPGYRFQGIGLSNTNSLVWPAASVQQKHTLLSEIQQESDPCTRLFLSGS